MYFFSIMESKTYISHPILIRIIIHCPNFLFSRSPEIDHLLLTDDIDNATSIIRPNSISSLDNILSDHQSVKEDHSRIRQKTYTKPNIISSEVNGNNSSIQLWSGPSTTRKGIILLYHVIS